MSSPYVAFGFVKAPHGVRGLVKIKTLLSNATPLKGGVFFTETEGAYKPLGLTFKSALHDGYIAQVEGCDSREDAEQIKRLTIYTTKECLEKGAPKLLDTLIGKLVYNETGVQLGAVDHFENHGATDIVCVSTLDDSSTPTVDLPYVSSFVQTSEKGLVVSQEVFLRFKALNS